LFRVSTCAAFVGTGRIEILKPITFEKNKSDLIGEGENILNQVAATFVAVQALSEKHGLPLPRFLVEGTWRFLHFDSVNFLVWFFNHCGEPPQ